MIEINDHGGQRKLAAEMHKLAKQLPKEMVDSLEKSCGRLKDEIINSAASILPQRGGLAHAISSMSIDISTDTNGVTMTGSAKYNLDRIDSGEISHPVYGRKPSVRQSITPGFWSKSIDKSEDEFSKELEKSADDLIRKMTD